jgi:predicted CXXCH cytochrome family protein
VSTLRRFFISATFLGLLAGFAGIPPAKAAAPAPQQTASQSANPPSASDASPQTCAACHGDLVRQLAASPHAHRATEHSGKDESCSACHGPADAHVASGGDASKLQKSDQAESQDLQTTAIHNAVCTQCHTAEAGPFVHEHPVVKAEGCTSCHAVHGGAGTYLLNQSDVNTLCRQCHYITASVPSHAAYGTGTAHTTDPACTTCHTQVHGSSTSETFVK